jgi:hypothetical protein
MKKIMIAHEAPIPILKDVQRVTDYDYALVHLFEKHQEYKDFFVNAVRDGREVLLDNSIFELGVAFDSEKFAKEVLDLKPSYYIVPDVLEDGFKTVQSFERFIMDYPRLPGLKIGVVQGRTYDELVECYKYMSEMADYIAISFDYSYYLMSGLGKTKLERWCYGRAKFIGDLLNAGIWNREKPHHLLGCSLAKEFANYWQVENIRSVDTSNPVVAGLNALRYTGNLGLQEKPSVKLADLIEKVPTDDQMEDIYYNMKSFRSIVC